MSENTLVVIKQPTASTVVRGAFYIVVGAIFLGAAIAGGETFFEDAGDLPFLMVLPLLGVIFPLMGIGNIAIALTNSGRKGAPVTLTAEGKVRIPRHILGTPILSSRTAEMNRENLKLRIKIKSIAGPNRWYKICFQDGSRVLVLRVFKLQEGTMDSLMNALTGQGVDTQ